jgi:hypothetical protein
MLEGFALLVAIALSLAWLFGAGTYVDGHIGWENLAHQHPSELAALMAGVFAPLALLWLLVAYFRQANAQRQLAFALKQLHWQARKSAEQTETIVRQLAETQDHERQAAALEIADRALADLQSLAARLGLGLGRLTPGDVNGLWRVTKSGDRFAFLRALLGEGREFDDRKSEYAACLSADPALRQPMTDFIQLQERLADFAAKRAIDPMLREALEQGEPAKLHALLLSVLRAEPAASSPHPPEAEGANPSAAMLANQVARVLWPQGVSDEARAAPPIAAIPGANPSGAAPELAPVSEAAESGQDAAPDPANASNVMPFSPLSPGFPRQPGS